ncbi:hypothetical protein PLICRDRAFT_171387 [Plicaturopsis crispa FD-325 SS-3]|nr:hypothetical protein PLICRDRAFT_171387 [Plicaturopsis crispa FD-325 SS-3]
MANDGTVVRRSARLEKLQNSVLSEPHIVGNELGSRMVPIEMDDDFLDVALFPRPNEIIDRRYSKHEVLSSTLRTAVTKSIDNKPRFSKGRRPSTAVVAIKYSSKKDSLRENKITLNNVHVRIINFRHAVLENEDLPVIRSRNRCSAPEMMKGILWDSSVDAFALGCIIAETHVGRILFPETGSDRERLSVLQRLLGLFDDSAIERISTVDPSAFHLFAPRTVRYPGHSVNPGERALVPPHSSTYKYAELKNVLTLVHIPRLRYVLRGLLHLNSRKRMSVVEASEDEYFESLD